MPGSVGPSCGKRGERIKQRDEIEKLLLWPKRLRRRQVALLGLVLVVDLLDLATVDPQEASRQEMLSHLEAQALEQGLGSLRFEEEGQ